MHCPYFENTLLGVSGDRVLGELLGTGFVVFAMLVDVKVESVTFTLRAPFICIYRRKVLVRLENLVVQFSASLSAIHMCMISRDTWRLPPFYSDLALRLGNFS